MGAEGRWTNWWKKEKEKEEKEEGKVSEQAKKYTWERGSLQGAGHPATRRVYRLRFQQRIVKPEDCCMERIVLELAQAICRLFFAKGDMWKDQKRYRYFHAHYVHTFNPLVCHTQTNMISVRRGTSFTSPNGEHHTGEGAASD